MIAFGGRIGLLALAVLFAVPAWAAERVITLAPHLAELVVEAGAGDQLVGVIRYSDYPPQVTSLPVVGDAFNLNHEQILALRPTRLLAWAGGTPEPEIRRLEALGLRVDAVDVRRLNDVADALRHIGRLLGTPTAAEAAARSFAEQIESLRVVTEEPLRVYYQVSAVPLYSLNGEHAASDVIRLCGGRNIFADAPVLAPQVSREAVLAERPDVILYSGEDGAAPWQPLLADRQVLDATLARISPDLLARPGPRLAQGARAVCAVLARVKPARSSPADSHPAPDDGRSRTADRTGD